MKILNNIEPLDTIRKKNSNKKIVLVHGVFDITHLGHLEYFKEAKSYGNILVVSVTSDKFVNKGLNRPYFNLKNRMNLLAEFSIIDYVVPSNSPSSIKVIKALKPNYYIKGPDYKIKENDNAQNLLKEEREVKKHGGKLKFTSGKIYSSTKKTTPLSDKRRRSCNNSPKYLIDPEPKMYRSTFREFFIPVSSTSITNCLGYRPLAIVASLLYLLRLKTNGDI